MPDPVYALYLDLAAATALSDCATLFRDFVGQYGFDTFACGEFDLRNRDLCVFYVIDWPERWREFYVRSGLIHHDPLLDRLEITTQPFTWSDLRADRTHSRVGSEAVERVALEGWNEGLVVPIPTSGNRLGMVSLVGHETVTAASRPVLILASLCFHSVVRVHAAREGFAVPPAGLSPREMEALRLVATGASDPQIAAQMGVARSTAHEFVENAKRKVKAGTRTEMVALAAALGIVEI